MPAAVREALGPSQVDTGDSSGLPGLPGLRTFHGLRTFRGLPRLLRGDEGLSPLQHPFGQHDRAGAAGYEVDPGAYLGGELREPPRSAGERMSARATMTYRSRG